MNYRWELLAEGVWRTRLPFLDVTVGLVCGGSGALLVDAGSTHTEAQAIESDVLTLTGQDVTHIVLTHNHFDHILGASWFRGAEHYAAPEVAATVRAGARRLRADAISHGADPDEVDRAVVALRPPDHEIHHAALTLGNRAVTIEHPGRGHTDHDLIVVVPGEYVVVFCGDLVEESGDPAIDEHSDVGAWPSTLDVMLAAAGPDALLVPGHGAVVDADFVRQQQQWLRTRAPG